MLVKLKGIHKVKRRLASGEVRVHYYAWRGGPKMEAEPNTESFAAELLKHRAESAPAEVKTLDDLIDTFQKSPAFSALAEKTQDAHKHSFKEIRKEWPKLPLKLTQQRGMKAMIRKWHHTFSANPRKADQMLFSLSRVFTFGIDEETIEKNPCTGINRLYTGSRKESVWTPELIALFRAKAKAHMLLAFEMAIHTGQRQGDLLSLTWKQYDGTHLSFQQGKTKKRVRVKVHSKLKAMIDALPKDKMRIMNNSRGRPWTKDGFKTSWAKECARLNKESDGVQIEGVTFHDLRGTFITERRREGSTTEQIASITGHSIAEVGRVLEKHYLATDQQTSDAVILRMEKNIT
ncbi:tyrosine-type recombinase/integrase [Ensifer sp. ENS10]|uniref:tyrosine-type recombinase/integrase n=1 Tax=unclassified Ensifer TaxID=2633371 RepID=UPI000DE5B07F|nr:MULTISPECIES: tyrosine-type recombinase/integrase [unclassified Ensifer]MBD9510048.1 tyrosine-type recombinase/integrase [Ensifer sp. ENS10]MBV7522360.1 tyrosine-type recombinase/integrase [Ensifer sp. ENS12]